MASSYKIDFSNHPKPTFRTGHIQPTEEICPECEATNLSLNRYTHIFNDHFQDMQFGDLFYKVCSDSECGYYKFDKVSDNLQAYINEKNARTDLDEAKCFLTAYNQKHWDLINKSGKTNYLVLSETIDVLKQLVKYVEKLDTNDTMKEPKFPVIRGGRFPELPTTAVEDI
jgi:hypothetical protein